MKKILNKVLIIILLTFCMFSLLNTSVYARSITDIFTSAGNFLNAGNKSYNPIDEDYMQDMSGILYNTLLIIGIIVAVILGIVLGIKIMAGSVEEKAKTKESLIAYVAGCVVVFGAFTIWKIVVTILQST